MLRSCCLILSLTAAANAQEPKRPDVLFIAVDDLNHWVGHLGRNAQVKTPNIDRLAARGVSFTRAYCAAPACNPSRTALMSGIRPSTTGCYVNPDDWRPLVAEDKLLNNHFQRSGYAVLGAGKIFHGGLTSTSWDDYFNSGTAYRTKPKAERVAGTPFSDKGIRFGQLAGDEEVMNDHHVVDWCIDRLGEDRDESLFLACGIFRPHMPWTVPKKYFDLYPLDKIELPPFAAGDLDDVPPAGVRIAKPKGDHHTVTGKGLWRESVQAYLASISYADYEVGRLLDALDASGRADNTVVVLWGDHGWHLGEKSHWRKFALWEEATRAPLVWIAPGVTKAGATCDTPVDFLNVYPTLCDLTGLPTPDHCEGTSLRPLLADPQTAWDRPALTTHGHRNHAVRSGPWRYIRYAGGGEELYDHRDDPLERTNLAARPGHADRVEAMKALLPTDDLAPPPRRKRVRNK